MNGSFLLTPAATRDIDHILEYILEHSGANRALHVHRRLYQGLSRIAENPGLGHFRDDLADESLRVYAVFSYLIIYRPGTRPLQILRVIHGARDLPRAFQQED